MRLAAGIEALEGVPILYLKKLNAIVCSDLHLGYEGVMADQGTFLPKANLKTIKSVIGAAVKKTSAGTIIIDGDIKNEFSKVHLEEMNEFLELIKFLQEEMKLKRIIIVKGNHDNFINRVVGSGKVEVYEQEAEVGGFIFFHGEELPREKGQVLVMGHVHPSVSLQNMIGVREKLKCFLYGTMKDKRRLIVLPAMSYFAEGMSVNLEDVARMAPIFRSRADINKMEVLCIGNDETLRFGSVGELRAIS